MTGLKCWIGEKHDCQWRPGGERDTAKANAHELKDAHFNEGLMKAVYSQTKWTLCLYLFLKCTFNTIQNDSGCTMVTYSAITVYIPFLYTTEFVV